jgi:hypothetical protein
MATKAEYQAMADQSCSPFNSGQPTAGKGAYAEDAWVAVPEGRWPSAMSRQGLRLEPPLRRQQCEPRRHDSGRESQRVAP